MFLVGTEEGKIYKVRQCAPFASSLIGWLRPWSLSFLADPILIDLNARQF